MFLSKFSLIGLVAATIAVVPATAGTLTTDTWFLGSSASNTGGIALTDGSSITGSFTFAADVSTPNCGACTLPQSGSDAAGDFNGTYGLFGNGSTTTGGITGSISVTLSTATQELLGINAPSTWYINTNDQDAHNAGPDCCSDAYDLFLVSENPTTTNDLTGAYGILIGLTGPMTDPGAIFAVSGGDQLILTDANFGVCDDYACGQVSSSDSIGSIAGLSDSGANVNTGNLPSIPSNPSNPGGGSATPEPSTLLLGASVLVLGVIRRKSLRQQ